VYLGVLLERSTPISKCLVLRDLDSQFDCILLKKVIYIRRHKSAAQTHLHYLSILEGGEIPARFGAFHFLNNIHKRNKSNYNIIVLII
jgi:hypothetical protein